MDAAFRNAVESGAMPGIVAMAANRDGLIYQGAYGVRSVQTGAPMTLDTVVWLASMTKAITATATMQLVEEGKLSLEEPASNILPELAAVKVLEGFDDNDVPRLRAPRRPITVKHLLTHTAGFGYDMMNPLLGRYAALTQTPPTRSCRLMALNMPLTFDPGECWEYGINIDWLGRVVERVSGMRLDRYFQQRIFDPLGMHDTAFKISPSQASRLAGVHSRTPEGGLKAIEFDIPQEPEFHMGGGGLYGTAADYLKFTGMFLNEGRGDNDAVLNPETVALMAQNHIGDLNVEPCKSAMPAITNDVDWFHGKPAKWGLSFLINTEATVTGRSAGSLAWAGLANSYYWIDRHRGVSGVFLSQLLPFRDGIAVALFDQFESAVYQAIG